MPVDDATIHHILVMTWSSVDSRIPLGHGRLSQSSSYQRPGWLGSSPNCPSLCLHLRIFLNVDMFVGLEDADLVRGEFDAAVAPVSRNQSKGVRFH